MTFHKPKPKKRLDGHIFHFDMDCQKFQTTFTGNIEKLGGLVSPFFSKNVTHVITNRDSKEWNTNGYGLNKTPNGRGNTTMANTSSASKRIPLACVQSPNSNGGIPSNNVAAPSPRGFHFNFDASLTSPMSAFANSPCPIPDAIKTHGNRRRYSISNRGPLISVCPESDVIMRALEWNKKIWTLDRLKECINKYLNIPISQPSKNLSQCLKEEKKLSIASGASTEMKENYYMFRYPYLMLEDAADEYKPVYKEFIPDKQGKTVCPKLEATHDCVSPFYAIKGDRKRKLQEESMGAKEIEQPIEKRQKKVCFQKHWDLEWGVLREFDKIGPKMGYCECCLTKFSDIHKHVDVSPHKNFANNSSNYREIDYIFKKLCWINDQFTIYADEEEIENDIQPSTLDAVFLDKNGADVYHTPMGTPEKVSRDRYLQQQKIKDYETSDLHEYKDCDLHLSKLQNNDREAKDAFAIFVNVASNMANELHQDDQRPMRTSGNKENQSVNIINLINQEFHGPRTPSDHRVEANLVRYKRKRHVEDSPKAIRRSSARLAKITR